MMSDRAVLIKKLSRKYSDLIIRPTVINTWDPPHQIFGHGLDTKKSLITARHCAYHPWVATKGPQRVRLVLPVWTPSIWGWLYPHLPNHFNLPEFTTSHVAMNHQQQANVLPRALTPLSCKWPSLSPPNSHSRQDKENCDPNNTHAAKTRCLL
jgi:hypothetical protein